MATGLRIAVEGNIGVGKSTLLPKLRDALASLYSADDSWDVMDERVDQDPEFKRLLGEFYKDANKQVQLQSWITYRRLQEFKALDNNPKNYLFERSFLGEVVFCHANFLRHEKPEGNFLGFFYNILGALKQCPYDAVIYLKADPERCIERIKYRARSEETEINPDYVRFLHACYEAHLPETARAMNIPVLTIEWDNFGTTESIAEKLQSLFDVTQKQSLRLVK
jgi:deoxyadenosine/deoxycytidine kinase